MGRGACLTRKDTGQLNSLRDHSYDHMITNCNHMNDLCTTCESLGFADRCDH